MRLSLKQNVEFKNLNRVGRRIGYEWVHLEEGKQKRGVRNDGRKENRKGWPRPAMDVVCQEVREGEELNSLLPREEKIWRQRTGGGEKAGTQDEGSTVSPHFKPMPHNFNSYYFIICSDTSFSLSDIFFFKFPAMLLSIYFSKYFFFF